jgi:hypothetical protein
MNNQYLRYLTIKKDYESMMNLRGPLITWKPIGTINPLSQIFPLKYLVVYKIKAPTISGIRTSHEVEIDCSSANYPFYSPIIKFHTPELKHPHVFSDGSKRVCIGNKPLSETLACLCLRLARYFQFDSSIINPRSIASKEFYCWYLKNQNQLPLDHSALPSLDGFKLKIVKRG